VGTGVGTALGKLSQYYLTLADKIFPIIEVDAGRVVDIVLTKGIKMSVASPGQNQLSGLFPDEDQYSAVWKKGSQLLHKSLDPIN
jgi:conjugal transfer pilus assembly protein TraB